MEVFKTTGVCARTIEFEIDGDIVTDVKFNGGCAGNTQGVAKLAKGRKIDELIEILEGTLCRNGTSCPDQFARALKAYKETHK